MSFASAEEAKKHRNTYLVVFAALGALTILTVAIAYVDLDTPIAIAVAMLVALVKGSLVACYFMHLLTEKQTLFNILIVSVVFFFVLLLTPVLAEQDAVGKSVQNYVKAATPEDHEAEHETDHGGANAGEKAAEH